MDQEKLYPGIKFPTLTSTIYLIRIK